MTTTTLKEAAAMALSAPADVPALPEPAAHNCYWNGDNDSVSWDQWHDASDPMPAKWTAGEEPDEVTAYYTADQMRAYGAACRAAPVQPVAPVIGYLNPAPHAAAPLVNSQVAYLNVTPKTAAQAAPSVPADLIEYMRKHLKHQRDLIAGFEALDNETRRAAKLDEWIAALAAAPTDVEQAAETPARVALTEAEILKCVRSVGLIAPMGLTRDRGPYEVTEPTHCLVQLVRAIERAHGIQSGTDGEKRNG